MFRSLTVGGRSGYMISEWMSQSFPKREVTSLNVLIGKFCGVEAFTVHKLGFIVQTQVMT